MHKALILYAAFCILAFQFIAFYLVGNALLSSAGDPNRLYLLPMLNIPLLDGMLIYAFKRKKEIDGSREGNMEAPLPPL